MSLRVEHRGSAEGLPLRLAGAVPDFERKCGVRLAERT